jgi:hypothetical protein
MDENSFSDVKRSTTLRLSFEEVTEQEKEEPKGLRKCDEMRSVTGATSSSIDTCLLRGEEEEQEGNRILLLKDVRTLLAIILRLKRAALPYGRFAGQILVVLARFYLVYFSSKCQSGHFSRSAYLVSGRFWHFYGQLVFLSLAKKLL